MSDYNYIGNLSTVVKTILLMISGWAIGYFTSKGLNLPISEEQLSELLFMMVCLAVAYIDAKYPNSFPFLHNHKEEFIVEATEEDLINPDYYEEETEI